MLYPLLLTPFFLTLSSLVQATPASLIRPAQTDSIALSPPSLSPWSMYQHADTIVQGVMLLLFLASVLTWTIALIKAVSYWRAQTALKLGLSHLQQARTLHDALQHLPQQGSVRQMAEAARQEFELSLPDARHQLAERVQLRQDRLLTILASQMNRGTGLIASIASTAPFIGLLGTVWGIMHSFIGIAGSQTTNLAVVAPGIAEALLATGLGLVAAIPATLMYNAYARALSHYKTLAGNASAAVMLLVSRDLERLET